MSQLAGAFCGVLVAPGIYKFYTTSFPIGIPGTQYSVPFATVYRLMSVVSANGFNDLPDYCLAIGGAFFGLRLGSRRCCPWLLFSTAALDTNTVAGCTPHPSTKLCQRGHMA